MRRVWGFNLCHFLKNKGQMFFKNLKKTKTRNYERVATQKVLGLLGGGENALKKKKTKTLKRPENAGIKKAPNPFIHLSLCVKKKKTQT